MTLYVNYTSIKQIKYRDLNSRVGRRVSKINGGLPW